MRHSFSHANSWLLGAAIAVTCGTNLIRAFRWRTLLTPLSPASVNEVFSATNIGIGASFLFGAAVGEVVRPLALSLLSKHVRAAASFLTILVERACDLSVLLILFGLTLSWLPELSGRFAEIAPLSEIGMILITLSVLGLGILILLRHRLADTQNWIAKRLVGRHPTPGKVRRGAVRFLQRLGGAFSVLSKKREFIFVTLWTGGLWLSVLLANWLILRAFGLSFGFKQTLLVMCCGLGGSLVPTPGGAAGAFHAAISGGLVFLGVTLEQAAAISITAHLTGFIPALVFGSYYFLRSGLKLTTLRNEMSAAAASAQSSW